MDDEHEQIRRTARYRREADGVEFDRVLYFSDAVFAIAMTLLVIEIGIPHVSDAQLRSEVADRVPEILSFFISFVVIGFYWLAHHRFFAQLRAADPVIMKLNLVYLAAIAFMPFPTALVGEYDSTAVSVILYATTLAVASLLETVMFAYARRAELLRVAIPDDVFRYAITASLLPVLVFALSIPIALVNSTAALLSWLFVFVAEHALDHWKPEGSDRLFR